jgi:hypothetical protein
MSVTTDTMLGYKCPFYLSNAEIGKSYYLYEIYSPNVSSKGNPTFALTKITERTDTTNEVSQYYPMGKESDIISYVANTKRVRKSNFEYVKNIYRNMEGVIVNNTYNKKDFPTVDMNIEDEGNTLQKQLIISLRDSLRWKSYRFSVGNYVDLLYSPTEFVVYQFVGGKDNTISLKPVAAYKTSDVELKNPLKVDLSKIYVPKGNIWNADKFSDINIALRLFEWESFKRFELCPKN